MRVTVVVITAPGHPTLFQSGYVIRHVVQHWSERGVQFELATDLRAAPAGDIGWQHLDATKVGTDYQRVLARYPVVINGGSVDVHKRRTASHIVTKDDSWDGPVIVKTDLNYGGRADDWAYRWRPMRHSWFHSVRDKFPAVISGRMDPHAYPIHPSKATVPLWVWLDRRFVVQRFLAERKNERYAIRRWFFFGESEFAYLSYGSLPIVSGDDHAEWERLDAPPDELRKLRTSLGLDYGKIDYAELDGELVVYDVNPAVSADGPAGSVLQREMVVALVPGLESFLLRVRR